jgi:hypothetical protein
MERRGHFLNQEMSKMGGGEGRGAGEGGGGATGVEGEAGLTLFG